MPCAPQAAQDIVNTDCEYGDSFVSVVLGEFIAVKSMSYIFRLLNR